MIYIMKPDEYVIGIDLGGTYVRAAAVLPAGKIYVRVKLESGAALGYGKVVKIIRSAVENVVASAGAPPLAIGLASAGAIDFSRKQVARSPNFPDWRNVPLAKDVGAGFAGCPITLENDANAAALGEGWLGAARTWPDFVMLTLGTGIGGGVILAGELLRGARGMAGEAGHIVIHPGGRPCGCGSAGCLETTASATGVRRTAIERMGDPDSVWLKKACRGDIGRIDARLIARLGEKGDPFCVRILKESGKDLGSAMGTLALVLGVSRFVIGGGMAQAFGLMKSSARRTALKSAYTLTGARLKIVNSQLGDDAGILGVAKKALDLIGS